MNLPKSVGEWAIWAVVTLAIVAAVYVAAGAFGIVIPSLIITLFWICVGCAMVVAVIRFLMSLGGQP